MRKKIVLICSLLVVLSMVVAYAVSAEFWLSESVSEDEKEYGPITAELNVKGIKDLTPMEEDSFTKDAGLTAYKDGDGFVYCFDKNNSLVSVEAESYEHSNEYALAIRDGTAEPISESEAEKIAKEYAKTVFGERIAEFKKIETYYDKQLNNYTVEFSKDFGDFDYINAVGCYVSMRDDGYLFKCALTKDYDLFTKFDSTELSKTIETSFASYVEKTVLERCPDYTSYEIKNTKLVLKGEKYVIEAEAFVRAPEKIYGDDIIQYSYHPLGDADEMFGIEIEYNLD